MQSLTHYLGCIVDFVSGLWGLVHVPAALEDNEGETSGQELPRGISGPAIGPCHHLGQSTAAAEQLPVPNYSLVVGDPGSSEPNLSRQPQSTIATY